MYSLFTKVMSSLDCPKFLLECLEHVQSGFYFSVDVVSVLFECIFLVASHSECCCHVNVGDTRVCQCHVGCVLYSQDQGVNSVRVEFLGKTFILFE